MIREVSYKFAYKDVFVSPYKEKVQNINLTTLRIIKLSYFFKANIDVIFLVSETATFYVSKKKMSQAVRIKNK